MLSTTEDCTCVVTGYAGYEDEILRLRNANRAVPETREYIDWRYREAPDLPSPLVFWLLSPAGARIGMASVIFRGYCVDGASVPVAVLGDISLESEWRGKGLGQRLMRFLTDHLDQRLPQYPGFVIPTESARRSLAAAHWRNGGTLIPHVFLVDPTRQLATVFGSRAVARQLARPFKALIRTWLARHIRKDCTFELTDRFDESFQSYWTGLPHEEWVRRDMNLTSLTWRYSEHPHIRFSIGKLVRHGQLLGYVVFALATEFEMCSVYDLLASTPADLACMMGLLVTHCMRCTDISTVRVTLGNDHPYRAPLRRLGFLPRSPSVPFQLYSRAGVFEQKRWSITSGDKDI